VSPELDTRLWPLHVRPALKWSISDWSPDLKLGRLPTIRVRTRGAFFHNSCPYEREPQHIHVRGDQYNIQVDCERDRAVLLGSSADVSRAFWVRPRQPRRCYLVNLCMQTMTTTSSWGECSVGLGGYTRPSLLIWLYGRLVVVFYFFVSGFGDESGPVRRSLHLLINDEYCPCRIQTGTSGGKWKI